MPYLNPLLIALVLTAWLSSPTYADPYAGYGSSSSNPLPSTGARTPAHPYREIAPDNGNGAANAAFQHNRAQSNPFHERPRVLGGNAPDTASGKTVGRARPGQRLSTPTPPRRTYSEIHPPRRRAYDRPSHHTPRRHYHRHHARPHLHLHLHYRTSPHDRLHLRYHRHYRYAPSPHYHRHHHFNRPHHYDRPRHRHRGHWRSHRSGLHLHLRL